MDMMEELDNEGVKIDPSIFKIVRKGSFRKIVDSRTYIFSNRVSNTSTIQPTFCSISTTSRSTKSSHISFNCWSRIKPICAFFL